MKLAFTILHRSSDNNRNAYHIRSAVPTWCATLLQPSHGLQLVQSISLPRGVNTLEPNQTRMRGQLVRDAASDVPSPAAPAQHQEVLL